MLPGTGIQAQTAECLVVSELVTDDLIVALNKVDLLPAEQRGRLVSKARKRVAATFALTKFRGCTMVPVAAKPGACQSCCSAASDIRRKTSDCAANVSPGSG